MKKSFLQFAGLSALLAGSAGSLLGQAAPAPSAAAAPADEIVMLSPFEVASSSDDRWVATNAVSGTRINVPLIELPLTINVVTSEFIQDIGASNLMEALRFTTGITQNPSGLQGFGLGTNNVDQFLIRGERVLYVYRDGLRRWRGHEAAFIDRAEIIKGPTALLYGEALPGGTINYITKTPRFQAGGYFLARIDEHGGYRAEFDSTGPLGSDRKFAYRVVGGYEGGRTWRDYESREHRPLMLSLLAQPWDSTRIVLTMENTSSRMKDFQTNGTVAWRGPDNRGGTMWDGSLGGAIGIHPLAKPGTNPYGTPAMQNYLDLPTESYALRIDQKLARGLDLRTSLTHIRLGNEGVSSGNNDVNVIDSALFNPDRTVVQAAPGDTITVGGRQYVVGRGSTLAGNPIANATPGNYQGGVRRVVVYRAADGVGPVRFVGNSLAAPNLFNPNLVGPRALSFFHNVNVDTTWQTDLSYSFEAGPTQHRLVGGYEMTRGGFEVYNTADNPAWVRNPDGTAIPGSDRNFWGVGYDIVRGIPVDIFGNEWTRPAPTSNVFSGGKQTQRRKSDSFYANYLGTFLDRRLNVFGGIRTNDISLRQIGQTVWQDYSKTVPQYGVLYKITPAVAVYANQSESFLLKNQRFPSVPPAASNPGAYVPNEVFPPERGDGTDIGVKFELRDRGLSGNVTWFSVTHDRVPIIDPNVLDANGNFVFYPSGEQEAKGIEVELFYQPTPQWQLMAGATWSDTQYIRVSRGQDYLIGRPIFGAGEWQFSGFAKYTFDEGALKGAYVGGGFYYLDERSIDPGRPFNNEAYVMFDLIAGYRSKLMDRPVLYTLNVSNILDEVAYQGFTGALNPRTISLSMRLEF